jgi:hypothetical protein
MPRLGLHFFHPLARPPDASQGAVRWERLERFTAHCPKFFDRVNHDILMGLVAKRVTDKRILKLTVNATAPAAAEPMSVSPFESVT